MTAPLQPKPAVVIRVVKVPTTGERLDAYYRERGLVTGSRGDTAVRGDGCRHVPARGALR